jgi:serine/threonine protein kinase
MTIFDRSDVEAALPGVALGPKLGSGGGGIVFAARQTSLGRDAAVKVLAGDGTTARDGIRTEARILASLDHPHIVAVYDLVEGATLSVIVMELMRGGSLAARFGRTDHPTLCAIALAVAEGLHFAHSNGVLHRDVEPANILFTADEIPKIDGFGIARTFEGFRRAVSKGLACQGASCSTVTPMAS